jgi:hypothetical protein
MTDLSAKRFQERQDGLAELDRQQVSMVAQLEMSSFVSEDGPTFVGAERCQQARRHDDASDSGGNRVGETTLRFHDLEPTAPLNAVHGLPTGEQDRPATKRRNEQRHQGNSSCDGTDLVMERDDAAPLDKR